MKPHQDMERLSSTKERRAKVRYLERSSSVATSMTMPEGTCTGGTRTMGRAGQGGHYSTQNGSPLRMVCAQMVPHMPHMGWVTGLQ